MKKRFAKHWPRSLRGITLVEVLAGSALLGTLLVAILLANAKLTAQTRRASQRVEACGIADGLLEKWWDDREDFPRSDSGPVENHAGWRWRTRIVEDKAPTEIRAEVVALEVFAPGQQQHSDPAARVEILLAGENREDAKRTDVD